MEYPKRVETGYQRRSIAFPSDHFVGHPDDFTFVSPKMAAYWAQFKAACLRFNYTNFLMGAGVKGKPGHPLIEWVVIARDEHGTDKVIWQQYQGASPRGAQNLIYSCGEVFKMTAFGAGSHDQQDAIIDTVHFRRMIRKFANDIEPVLEQIPTNEDSFTTVEELRVAKHKWMMQINSKLRVSYRAAMEACLDDDYSYREVDFKLYSGAGKTSMVILRRGRQDVIKFKLFSDEAKSILAQYGVKDLV